MNPDHTSFVRRITEWLWFTLAVLLGLPMILIVIALLCGVCDWGGPGYRAIVIVMAGYFQIPALLFGPAHFASSKAIYCPDLVGIVLTIGLYTGIAVAISLVLTTLPKLRRLQS